LQKHLYLGNLDATRDWGFAGDYVEAMWLMLQHDHPDDFVVATGTAYSVRDFLALAFARVGLDWQDHVKMDARYLRPTEVEALLGDATKARDLLGWKPTTSFEQLVDLMVASDWQLAREERAVDSHRAATVRDGAPQLSQVIHRRER
jgi:GDPmannose 4,6-dehydratase